MITEKQIDIVCDSENTPQSISSNAAFDQISANVNNVLQELRDSPKHDFIALKGWRNECYNIRPTFSSPPLFKMERSATCKYLTIFWKKLQDISFSALHCIIYKLFGIGMFGLRQYGVDINGYVMDPEKGLCIWMQKRSVSKPTWPGKWDNFVSYIILS